MIGNNEPGIKLRVRFRGEIFPKKACREASGSNLDGTRSSCAIHSWPKRNEYRSAQRYRFHQAWICGRVAMGHRYAASTAVRTSQEHHPHRRRTRAMPGPGRLPKNRPRDYGALSTTKRKSFGWIEEQTDPSPPEVLTLEEEESGFVEPAPTVPESEVRRAPSPAESLSAR